MSSQTMVANLRQFMAQSVRVNDDPRTLRAVPHQTLDGVLAYIHELTAERDALRHRARRACQTIVAAVGADGPLDIDEEAERIVAQLATAVAERDVQYAVRKQVLFALEGQGLPRVMPEDGHGVIQEAHNLRRRADDAQRTLARLMEPSDAMVESVAPTTFSAMQLRRGLEFEIKPWVLYGNSLAQGDARRATRNIIRAAVAKASAPEDA